MTIDLSSLVSWFERLYKHIFIICISVLGFMGLIWTIQFIIKCILNKD